MNKELLADKLKVKDAKLFIDGQYVDSVCGETFDTFNPATNRKLASIAKANEEDTKEQLMWQNVHLKAAFGVKCLWKSDRIFYAKCRI